MKVALHTSPQKKKKKRLLASNKIVGLIKAIQQKQKFGLRSSKSLDEK